MHSDAKRELNALLSTTTLHHFLASRPPAGVIALCATSTLATALHRLSSACILSAPVFDDISGGYAGFVEVLDILSALFDGGGQFEQGATAAASFLGTTTVAQILRSNDVQLIHASSTPRLLLSDVIRQGFVQPKYKLWCHRVAVFDNAASSSSLGGGGDDGVIGNGDPLAPPSLHTLHGSNNNAINIISVVSQFDIIKFLLLHSSQVPTLMAQPLAALGLGRKKVFSVPHTMSAAAAFRAMFAGGATAAAVVDTNGKLWGNLSPSDLCGLSPATMGQLTMPLSEFLALRSHSPVSPRVADSLAVKYGVFPRSSGSWNSGGGGGGGVGAGETISVVSGSGLEDGEAMAAEGPSPSPTSNTTTNGRVEFGVDASGDGDTIVASVPLTATLGETLRLLADRSVHRVYLTEPNDAGAVAGVVSLTDILTALVGM